MALVQDLITASKIEGMVAAGGASLVRIESPTQLPPNSDVDLLVVDWGDRQPEWGAAIAAWRDTSPAHRSPRVILFGPHTDLVAHADARKADLGPMRARSAFFGALSDLLKRPERIV